MGANREETIQAVLSSIEDYKAGRIDRQSLEQILHQRVVAQPSPPDTTTGSERDPAARETPFHDPGHSLRSGATADQADPFIGPDTPPSSRFQVLSVHAEGGVGTVYRAYDTELDREVALKQIKMNRVNDPESRARFDREGTITGTLEHPGIIPVYGRGRFPNDSPYYAMRLVRGVSLREAIDSAFTEIEGDHGSIPPRVLRGLVGRLAQASLAVEYAHSRGILHRDLKPENIMLGPFGETLVVDWGLAKQLGYSGSSESTSVAARGTLSGSSVDAQENPRAELDDPETDVTTTLVRITPIISESIGSLGPQETSAGQIQGTIGYMSPEQAKGDQEQIGLRSDVFGLGATLYCMLVNEPPISGEGGPIVALHRAIHAEIKAPSTRRSGVDPDLERICLRAVEADPKRRYPTARAFAEALDEWLAEERARTVRALFNNALDTYGTLVTTVQERLGSLPAAREVREELLGTAVSGLEKLVAHAEREQSSRVDRALAEAHRRLGEIALQTGKSTRAKAHFERSLDAFRALVESDDAESGDYRGFSIALGRLGDIAKRLGSFNEARTYYDQGLEASHRFASLEPEIPRSSRGVAIAYGKRGDLARQSGNLDEARRDHECAFEIASKLRESDPHDAESIRTVAMALDKLGDLERQAGDFEAARQRFLGALDAAESLASQAPRDYGAQRGLAIALNKLGEVERLTKNLEPARNALRRAMTLFEGLGAADPKDVEIRRDLAICLTRLGDADRLAGDLESARCHYDAALGLARDLNQAEPESARARRGLAIALNKRGSLDWQIGRLSDAREAALEAFQLITPIAETNPDDTQAQLDAARIAQRLSDISRSLGNPEDATGWLDAALSLLSALQEQNRLPLSCAGWLASIRASRDEKPRGDSEKTTQRTTS